MFIDANPLWGGIIDKAPALGEWFVVFNHDDIPTIAGLASKCAALDVFELRVAKFRMNAAMQEVEKFCTMASAIYADWEIFQGVGLWSYTTVELPNGNMYRLGCSGGGIISINGKPFHSDGTHLEIWEQVSDMIINHVKDIPSHEVSIFNKRIKPLKIA